MFNYECDYSEENGLQKCKQETGKALLVPRSNPRLFYEGKQFGVCRRGAVSLANPRSHWRAARIFPSCFGLSVPSWSEQDVPVSFTPSFGRM